MALTDHCDLYAAVHEDGVNLVAHHVMRQRPSLFNYATQYVADHSWLACSYPVDHTKDIDDYNNPIFHVQAPLPLLGVDAPPVALNYCVQLVRAQVDFHPGNQFALPAELSPPLQPQHLAFHVRVCGGLDCPIKDFIDGIHPWPPQQQPSQPGPKGDPNRPATGAAPQPAPPFVPPTRKLICFCLDAYVIGHAEIQNLFGAPTLVVHADDVDIVDIKPDELESAINCYLRTMFELLLREKLMFPVIKTFLFDFGFLKLPKITVSLSPPPGVPNNPAVEDDQIKVFVDVKVAP